MYSVYTNLSAWYLYVMFTYLNVHWFVHIIHPYNVILFYTILNHILAMYFCIFVYNYACFHENFVTL